MVRREGGGKSVPQTISERSVRCGRAHTELGHDGDILCGHCLGTYKLYYIITIVIIIKRSILYDE